MQFTFTAPLWLYSGKGAWHFLTLPKDAADEIKFFNRSAKGFTPIKVAAEIGATSWKTAIFPDSKSGSFVIAIKADVRRAERLIVGKNVTVTINVGSDI